MDNSKNATNASTPELSNLTVSKDQGVKPADDQKETSSKPAGNQKTNEQKQKVKPEEKKMLPPMEARLKKFQELEALLERRESIKEHLQNVAAFYISPTGNCHLKFTDSAGKTFGIAHPIVIGEMVHMAKEKLQQELDQIEKAFDFTI